MTKTKKSKKSKVLDKPIRRGNLKKKSKKNNKSDKAPKKTRIKAESNDQSNCKEAVNTAEFFCDPDAFRTLKETVFPQLIRNRPSAAPIRVWVPGCSTGEDVYSLAILLIEFLSHAAAKIPIQILATDISETVVQTARAGIYSTAIEHSVGNERLKGFFYKVEGGFKINKAIRDLCLFTKHDVANDPPFSKLDLVFFRNMLTYSAPNLQNRIISIFHYALNPGGFLFLGGSEEGPAVTSQLFAVLNKTYKIYSRADVSTSWNFRLPANTYAPKIEAFPDNVFERTNGAGDFQKNADNIALLKYAPPSVVVNVDLEILQFRGRTFPFLAPASGVPTRNLLKMAKKEMLHGLRLTVLEAIKKNTAVRKEGISFEAARSPKLVNIEVIPVNPLLPPSDRTFVIFFEVANSSLSSKPPASRLDKKLSFKKEPSQNTQDKQHHRIDQLEQELSASNLYQQSLAEEFGATQEELATANEELQSTNEELRGTNEELATAKEEIQSSYEELTTVNDELQIRNRDLNTTGSDLENILNSSEIPILIVGNDHRIRRFTSKTEKYFKLIPSDVGRLIGDIKSEFDLDLDALLKEVSNSLKSQEKEIKDRKGRWVRFQIRPYKTTDNKIDGAVITLVDIEALKQQIEVSKKAQDYLTSISETVGLPLLILDDQLRLRSANHAFWEHFKLSQNITGKDFFETLEIQGDSLLSMKKLLTETLKVKKKIKNVEMICEFPLLGRRTLLISVSLIQWMGEMPQEPQEPQEPQAILLSFDDITERREHRAELAQLLVKEQSSRAEAEQANKTKDDFISTLSHELRTPLTSILTWSQLIQKQNFGPDKLKHGLKMIEQSAKMQGQLINDLLDVTRIRSGKLSITFSEFDPKESVMVAMEAVHPLAESKQISVESKMKIQSEKIWGDRDRLKQIVWNLLTNAIKFSSKGGVIRVLVEAVEENGDHFASIKVIDQGKGILSEFLPKLFDRFSQADSSSIRVHGGLGLGLSIVRDLVQLQSGTVRAESEGLGKGATFTVLFPIRSGTGDLENKTTLIAENKMSEMEPANLSGLRVLVVEDDPSALEVLIEALNSLGAKTLPCGTVSDAVAAFEKFRPSVLVSDISMPGEDGYSLIRKIRKLGPEHNGDLPSLALTAFATAGDVQKALSAGFNSHMVKPFEAFHLGHMVAELAKKKVIRD